MFVYCMIRSAPCQVALPTYLSTYRQNTETKQMSRRGGAKAPHLKIRDISSWGIRALRGAFSTLDNLLTYSTCTTNGLKRTPHDQCCTRSLQTASSDSSLWIPERTTNGVVECAYYPVRILYFRSGSGRDCLTHSFPDRENCMNR